MEEENILIKDLPRRFFDFLKKDKNLGVLTWLTTIFVTFSVAIMKLCKYASECGKLVYWRIPLSVINVAGDNIVYDIVMAIIFGTVLMVFFLIPYFICVSKLRVVYKILWNVLIVSIISILFFFLCDATELIKNKGVAGLVAFIIADIIFIFIYYSLSIILVAEKFSKKKTKITSISKKGILIFIVVLIVVFALYCFASNFYFTKNNTLFRVTDDGYAIIYETDTSYYLAEYDEVNNVINKNKQKIIEKSNVEYSWKSING